MTIVLDKIKKSFGNRLVLENVSRELPDGARIALMGPSGVGKTTLLSILAGLQEADAGKVSGIPKRLAMVFQEDRLIEGADAVTNLKLTCGKRYTEAELIQELHQIGIEDAVGKPVESFSGGMKRRVAIVRAVLAEAELVLLDEPFKGLDAECKLLVMEYVKQHTVGKTLLLATHEPEEAQVFQAEIWKLE